MAAPAAPKPVQEPFPISLVANRYLLFDIDIIAHCRRNHNICGMLVGTIPNLSQQNVFLGVPLELMPEEARVLVELGAAYIVDDGELHRRAFGDMSRDARLEWLRELDGRAEEVTRGTEEVKQAKRMKALRTKGLRVEESAEAQRTAYAVRQRASAEIASPDLGFIMKGSSFSESHTSATPHEDENSTALFDSPPTSTPPSSTSPSSKPLRPQKHFVTPTTSFPALTPSPPNTSSPLPPVPKSYPLFRHLHAQKYYHMPGLRFGCHYNVYPGDPLRYHSHFAATGLHWDEAFTLLDIVGGGRLATGTKKAYMIGGEDADARQRLDAAQRNGTGAGLFSSPARDELGESVVRAFSVEWAGL